MKYPKLSRKELNELKESAKALEGPFIIQGVDKNGKEYYYERDVKDPDVQAYLIGAGPFPHRKRKK